MEKKKHESANEKPRYQLTAQERTKLRDHVALRTAETTPWIKVLNENNETTISLVHPNKDVAYALLAAALGRPTLILSMAFFDS